MTDKQKKELTAKYNLRDVDIVEVSFVKSPAVPDANFRVVKSDQLPEGKEFVAKAMVFKVKDPVKKQVFGYVAAPAIPDTQGDVMTAEEVLKTEQRFMMNAFTGVAKGTGIGGEHKAFGNIGVPIECAIDIDGSLAKAHGAEGIPGGWWFGAQCSDESWDKVEKGEYTAFSMGGQGVRDSLQKNHDMTLLSKAGEILKAIAMAVTKDDAQSFNDIISTQEITSKLWDLHYALQDSIRSILNDETVVEKATAVGTSIDQYKSAVLALISVSKAGAEIASGNMTTLTDVETALSDAAAKLTEMLTRIRDKMQTNKSAQGGPMAEKTKTVEELLKSLEEQLTGLSSRLDAVEKKEPPAPDPNAETPEQKLTKSLEKLAETVTKFDERLKTLEKTPEVRKGEGEVTLAAPDKVNKGAIDTSGTVFHMG